MKPLFSVVTLSWNSEDDLVQFFESIITQCINEKISFEIIIVDNGSNDTSIRIIRNYKAKYDCAVVPIYLNRNHGTTVTRNIALKQARGEFICIIDSDTEISEGSFTDLFDILEQRPDIGIVVPKLILPDKSIQNSVKRFPTFIHKIIKLPKAVLGFKTPNYDFYQDFPFENERKVETAISACWFFRRRLIQHVGLLDEKIFYSPEDLDYSIRIYKSGRSILFYPGFKVLHKTKQISHSRSFSRVSISHFIGLLYFFKKHGGWFSNSKMRRLSNAVLRINADLP